MQLRRFIIVALFLLLPVASAAQAEGNPAMAGVNEGKVVWNITMTDPEPLAGQMQVIRQTYKDLKEAGIDEPKMVLGFHSQNVRYLADDLSELPLEKVDAVRRFNDRLDKLMALDGVRVEACAIANQFFGMEDDAIRSGIHVVDNGYVSFVGYQQQGYGMIGIH